LAAREADVNVAGGIGRDRESPTGIRVDKTAQPGEAVPLDPRFRGEDRHKVARASKGEERFLAVPTKDKRDSLGMTRRRPGKGAKARGETVREAGAG